MFDLKGGGGGGDLLVQVGGGFACIAVDHFARAGGHMFDHQFIVLNGHHKATGGVSVVSVLTNPGILGGDDAIGILPAVVIDVGALAEGNEGAKPKRIGRAGRLLMG